MTPTYGDKDAEGKVLLHAEGQNNRLKVRFMCKIAFNYMALTCHPQFARSNSFDSLRAFIREGIGEGEGERFLNISPSQRKSFCRLSASLMDTCSPSTADLTTGLF